MKHERIVFIYKLKTMILYLSEDCKYIDYNTIKEKTKLSRSYLTRVLDKVEVRKMYYKNRLLVNYDDVLKSNELNIYFV